MTAATVMDFARIMGPRAVFALGNNLGGDRRVAWARSIDQMEERDPEAVERTSRMVAGLLIDPDYGLYEARAYAQRPATQRQAFAAHPRLVVLAYVLAAGAGAAAAGAFLAGPLMLLVAVPLIVAAYVTATLPVALIMRHRQDLVERAMMALGAALLAFEAPEQIALAPNRRELADGLLGPMQSTLLELHVDPTLARWEHP